MNRYESYMNMRRGRRAPRTWLEIQATTEASTSDDLRTLAQSRASSRRSVSRSTMGDRLIAASSAYKRAPADSSEPVLIDALPSIDRDLPDHSGRDDPPTLSRLKGSLRPHVLVAERAVPVRLICGPRAAGADGSDVAKLRQRRENRRSHEELSPFAAAST